ncbi:hypothetical protein BH24ACT5_BH24ACT5_21820 [soil metagenome]
MSVDLLPADEPRRIVSASLALGATVGLFGAVFGVGSVAAGASVLQTCVISLLVFTGASQFSAVSVVATGGGTAAALGGALLLAGRNTVYGLAMSRVITGSFARRLLASHFVIDDTTAMATTQPNPAAKRLAFWATGLTLTGSGTSAPWSERWSVRRSTRPDTGSTWPSRPGSWPW